MVQHDLNANVTLEVLDFAQGCFLAFGGSFDRQSLLSQFLTESIRVVTADFVILTTKFVTLRSIFSLCVAQTSLNKLPTGRAPDDESGTTTEKMM